MSMAERIAIAIDVTKNTGALQQTTAEVRAAEAAIASAGAQSANQIPSEGATTKSVCLVTAQCQVMYYREDLLKEAGIQPPKTHDELAAAVKALNKPDKGYHGLVLRGGGNGEDKGEQREGKRSHGTGRVRGEVVRQPGWPRAARRSVNAIEVYWLPASL